jgi:hypothetical protein
VNENVAPPLSSRELKTPVEDVQVWPTLSLFVTVTVSPTAPFVSPEKAKLAMVIRKSLGPVVEAVVVVVAAMVVVVVVCGGADVVGATVVLVAVVLVAVVLVAVVVVGTVVAVVGVVAVVAVAAVVVVVVVASDVVVCSVVVAAGSTVDPLQATANTSKKETVGRLIPETLLPDQSCFDLPRDRWTRFHSRTAARDSGPLTSAADRGWSSENGPAASSQPGGRTSNRLASNAMKIIVFSSPNPGKARSLEDSSQPVSTSAHTSSASPLYSSTIVSHRAWMRRAMAAG